MLNSLKKSAFQSPPPSQSPALATLLTYLQALLRWRLSSHLGKAEAKNAALPVFPALHEADESPLAHFIRQREPSEEEQVVLLLALAPQVYPNFFEAIVSQFVPQGGELSELGGVKAGNSRGMLPTGDTALFVLAGNDLGERLRLQLAFKHDSFYTSERMVSLESVKIGEPPMSGRLLVDPEMAEWLLTGTLSMPQLSAEFPAQYIDTKLNWEDLVLDPHTHLQIEELKHWLQHHPKLLYEWGMSKRIKAGYRCVFHGPPGTGKTLTAMLLGKTFGMPVFRIDLSMIVSKFIGETEKNLANLFDKAERKNWILFFDEADALFGKRTGVNTANDKFANQEVSYLLQRVENYQGLIVLATNLKVNIDEAFTRRFSAMIYFPLPKAEERLQLWQKAFPPQISLEADVDLPQIARQYELSGANIINIIQYCCIEMLAQEKSSLSKMDLLQGINREYLKEGRAM